MLQVGAPAVVGARELHLVVGVVQPSELQAAARFGHRVLELLEFPVVGWPWHQFEEMQVLRAVSLFSCPVGVRLVLEGPPRPFSEFGVLLAPQLARNPVAVIRELLVLLVVPDSLRLDQAQLAFPAVANHAALAEAHPVQQLVRDLEGWAERQWEALQGNQARSKGLAV